MRAWPKDHAAASTAVSSHGGESNRMTALKTISMYLRSTKTELEAAGESTEGMADSISKLREELLALTHGKVDIQLDEDSYKSTYDILKEMAGAWQDMTDMERAAATELMGGKRNSNVISALISDFSIAENSLQTALNSTGSAAKENEKYLDSIAGKLSQFEALSTSVVDSGLPKFFIELGTNVLSATEGIINFIDVFPALMGLLSGGLSLTGQKAGKSNMPSYASCDLIAA